MRKYFSFLFIGLLGLASSCINDFDIDLPEVDQELVVQGSIELDEQPIIFLTKSQNYFGTIDFNDYANFVVDDAEGFIVRNETDTFPLIQICLHDLAQTEQERRMIAQEFGFFLPEDQPTPNMCVITADVTGEENTQYDLYLTAFETSIFARTSIRELIPIDSIGFSDHPTREDLAVLQFGYTDPEEFGNFYRFFTKQNDGDFLISQTLNDRLFNGEAFYTPRPRSFEDEGDEEDPNFDEEASGFFYKGDTVAVRWSHITSETYDFWNTLENSGGGPFANPTIIKSNIEGALGIWAGYATDEEMMVIPKN